MNDQIVFEVGIEVVPRIQLIREVTLSLKAEQQRVRGIRRHVGYTTAIGHIKTIKHMVPAIGDNMQVDLMAMVEIGCEGGLFSNIKMKLVTTKPGKGEDLFV